MELKEKFIVLIIVLELCSVVSEKIEVLHEWKVLEFEFPNEKAKQSAIDNETYIAGKSIPIDLDYWEKDGKEKLFLTIPSIEEGVPASLVTVTDKDGKKGGKIVKPYPDYSWHTNEKKCDGFSSVFGTRIDECNRLWVIDSGKDMIMKEEDDQVCPERIFTFDLNTDKLDSKHELPKDVVKPTSVLTTLVVDVRDPKGKCEDTFVYIADIRADGMIVYDMKNKKWWRIEDDSMSPNPNHESFTVKGVDVNLNGGLIAIALAPVKNDKRLAYYHSLSSTVENWVPTAVLKNESNFKNGKILDKSQFKMSGEVRKSVTATEVFDSNGMLFFSPITEYSINCWNSEKPYTKENIHELTKDEKNLQFVNGVKFFKNQKGDEFLYMVSNRFQLVETNMLKMDDVNFRVIKGNIAELTKGTDCENKKPNQSQAMGDSNAEPNPALPEFKELLHAIKNYVTALLDQMN